MMNSTISCFRTALLSIIWYPLIRPCRGMLSKMDRTSTPEHQSRRRLKRGSTISLSVSTIAFSETNIDQEVDLHSHYRADQWQPPGWPGQQLDRAGDKNLGVHLASSPFPPPHIQLLLCNSFLRYFFSLSFYILPLKSPGDPPICPGPVKNWTLWTPRLRPCNWGFWLYQSWAVYCALF